MRGYSISPDIGGASTLPGVYYGDEAAFRASRERVFGRSWQWLGDLGDVAEPESLSPRTLLPGLLDEPLLLARDADGVLRCMSNVCTHRGNLLVPSACRSAAIRCGYHSRRFDLTGRMTFMPGFDGAKGFPSAADDLAQLRFASSAGHGFVSLDPAASFDDFFGDVVARMHWLPIESFAHAPERSRDYVVHAHWALYVENYLEGLHIPFVHAELADVVDHASYTTELFRYAALQVARARDGEAAFANMDPPCASRRPPEGQASAGTSRPRPWGDPAGADGRPFGARGEEPIAAYYWWLFPNLMLNFYPWGLSVNLVLPEAIDRTRIAFRSYVHDASKLDFGAGGSLDRVEAEDEAIVEAVQRGVRSRFYRGGRYSPSREQGVHHFHRLLCEFLEPA